MATKATSTKLDIMSLSADELKVKSVELRALAQQQLLNNALGSSSNTSAARKTQRTIARIMTRLNELSAEPVVTKEGAKE